MFESQLSAAGPQGQIDLLTGKISETFNQLNDAIRAGATETVTELAGEIDTLIGSLKRLEGQNKLDTRHRGLIQRFESGRHGGLIETRRGAAVFDRSIGTQSSGGQAAQLRETS